MEFAKVLGCKLRGAGIHFGVNRLNLLENEGKIQKYDHKPCEPLAMLTMYFIIF